MVAASLPRSLILLGQCWECPDKSLTWGALLSPGLELGSGFLWEKGWAAWGGKSYSTSRWNKGLNRYKFFFLKNQQKWQHGALHSRCAAVCVEQVKKGIYSHANSLNLITFSLTSLNSCWGGEDEAWVIAVYLRGDSSSLSGYVNNVYPRWHFTASFSSSYAQ